MRVTTIFLIAAGAVAAAGAVPEHRVATSSEPQVRSPQNGQHIGLPGDQLCADGHPCSKIRAEGWVPPDRVPFFVVGPVKAAPTMWAQPKIQRVSADGSFSGLVHLGEPENGKGEWFKIYVFACRSADALHDGKEITDVPDDCEISEAVDVFRER